MLVTGELTICDGNEFQTLTTRFVKYYFVASTEQVCLISLKSCDEISDVHIKKYGLEKC